MRISLLTALGEEIEMLNSLYDKLSSNAAVIIISLAIMLLCGFLMTRITKKLKLPNVTAYIVTGIMIGPFCLNLLPQSFIEGTSFLADIALAFIAFSTGEFFKFSKLKNNAGKVIVITLAGVNPLFCVNSQHRGR